MSQRRVQLGPTLLGGEVLARIARSRATGVLSWSPLAAQQPQTQLVFAAGRPEGAYLQAGQALRDRAQVVDIVRTVAVLSDGTCTFAPGGEAAEASLGIDTLGEVLVALLTQVTSKQLATLWEARGGYQVRPSSTFTRLAEAVVQVGGAAVRAPLEGAALASLAAGAAEPVQRTWLALLVLGGLEVTRKPAPAVVHAAQKITKDRPITVQPKAKIDRKPERETAAPILVPPANPEARRLFVEIRAAHQKLESQTHYEVLGVPPDANAETIRKAYFAMAKRWHSDRFSGTELQAEVVEMAAEVFRRVEEANRVLAHEEERKSYDYILERKARGLPTDPKVIMEAEALFKKGQRLVRQGEAQAAEPILAKALSLNPGEAEFWIYHGFALYSAQGKRALDQAKSEINKGLEQSPELDSGHEFLGRIARIEGDHAGAMKSLRRAVDINPQNIDATRELRLLTMGATAKPGKGADAGFVGLLNKVLKR